MPRVHSGWDRVEEDQARANAVASRVTDSLLPVLWTGEVDVVVTAGAGTGIEAVIADPDDVGDAGLSATTGTCSFVGVVLAGSMTRPIP
jgi:hypothetical protein